MHDDLAIEPQHGLDQVFLRREILIDRPFGYAATGQRRFHSRRMKAALIEPIESIFHDFKFFACELDIFAHRIILTNARSTFIANPVDQVNVIVYI
jgi:hypothetical protein